MIAFSFPKQKFSLPKLALNGCSMRMVFRRMRRLGMFC